MSWKKSFIRWAWAKMIALFLGRILQVILAITQIKLATAMLSPHEYGVWTLIMSLATLYILLVVSPFGLFFNRHVYEWSEKGFMGELFRSYSIFLLIASLASFLIFWVASSLHLIHFENVSPLMVASILGLSIAAQSFFHTWIPTFNIVGKKYRFVVGSSVGILFGMICSYVIAKLISADAINWIIGGSLGLVITAFLFLPHDWLKFNHENWKNFKSGISKGDIFSFSMPLIILTLLVWAQTQGYRFLIKDRIGLEALGLFSAGYSVVGGMFTSLEAVLASFSQPIFYKNMAKGKPVQDEMMGIWNLVFYPYVLAIVFLMVVGEDVAKIFLSSKFTANLEWIIYVPLAEGLRVILNNINFHLMGERKTFKLVVPQTIGLACMYGQLFFLKELSIKRLIFSIGLGYVVSIVIMVVSDFSFYKNIKFLKLVGASSLLGGGYVLCCQLALPFLNPHLKLVGASLFGVLFMLPYIIKNKKVLA